MIDLFARHARRLCVGSLLSLALAGCSVTGEGLRSAGFSDLQPQAMTHYAALSAEKFPVEAIDTSHIDSQFLRQVVDYRSPHPPGTVVVDPHRRFLYLVERGGKAIRYGVGVGREGWPLPAPAWCRRKSNGRTGRRPPR